MTEQLKKKIGQLFMFGFPTEGFTQDFADFCNKYYIGNFTVNANDCYTIEGLCELISKLRKNIYEVTGQHPLVQVDQECGLGTRIYEGAAMISGAMSFTAIGADSDKMYRIGQRVGSILRAVGCNLNTAPVLDVNINPNNPIIGTRSYGETPEKVVEMAIPYMEGMHSENVCGVVKHFPGHGNVSGDTHLNVVHNSESADTLRKTEYVPFKTAFEKGAGAVMTAHVIHDAFSVLPATVAPEIVSDLLRDELCFEGVTITDAMDMKGVDDLYPDGRSAPMALLAGCDVLLYYNYNRNSMQKAVDAVYAAVESGELTEEIIDISYKRIVALKERFDIASAEPDLELAKKIVYDDKAIAENFSDKVASVTKISDDGVLNTLEGKKILCVSPVWDALRGVEEKRRQVLSFADIFAATFENVTACVSSLNGLTPEVENAIAGDYDVAVVGIFEASSRMGQLEIVKALMETGKPVVAVLLRTPYDYRYVKDCNAVVTGYEYTTLSSKAIAHAMKNCDYRGKIPVTLPV